MELLSVIELVIWIRASAFSLALVELVKRVVRICGGDLKGSTLWVMSIMLTGLAVTLQFVEHVALTYSLWLWLPIMSVATPVAHKLIVMNGAAFIQHMVKKHTGYQMNLKALASGREYKPTMRKLITTESGGQKVVGADYKTNPSKGEKTLRNLREDETIFNETIFGAPPHKVPPKETEK